MKEMVHELRTHEITYGCGGLILKLDFKLSKFEQAQKDKTGI